MSESAAPKPASRIRTALLCACFLIAVVAIAWSLDGWLLARLRIIASDTFASGHPGHPLLLIDGSEELKTYTPLRLAKFLAAPSAQIRVVICLSLAERDGDYAKQRTPEAQEWSGIVPKLIRVSREDSDAEVRKCARAALWNVPIIPAEDVEAVLQLIESSLPNDDLPRVTLLTKVVRWHPDQQPRLIAYCQRCLDSTNREVRSAGFACMRSEAPKAPETLASFQEMMAAGDRDRVGASGGTWMLEYHPHLIDEFLVGNSAQRMLMFDKALEHVRNVHRSSHQKSATAPFSEPQLLKVDEFASEILVRTTPEKTLGETCEYLQMRPAGGQRLLAAARKANGAVRARAIQGLFNRLYPKDSAAAAACLPELLGWLDEGEPEVQTAILRFFGYDREWLTAQKSGYDSPIVKACRKIASRNRDFNDGIVFRMIMHAEPTLRSEEIDRLAAAACRSMKTAAERAAQSKRKALYYCYEGDEFERWLRRFPEHRNRPAVKTYVDLRAELEEKGLLAAVQ